MVGWCLHAVAGWLAWGVVRSRHHIDDAISIATRLLKGRIARQVWRDYHKHAFARRCYADPSDANLAEQHRARKQHEDERTEREELALARTFLAWRRGMG